MYQYANCVRVTVDTKHSATMWSGCALPEQVCITYMYVTAHNCYMCTIHNMYVSISYMFMFVCVHVRLCELGALGCVGRVG